MKIGMALAVACVGLLALAPVAQAQDNVFLNAPGILPKKAPPGPPEVRAQPQAWPRLDPGSVLCRSEADLNRLSQRRAGEVVDGPVDCQILRSAIAISILQRKGPGRTEVQTSDKANGTGWTDAWLPDKAPNGAKAASR